MAGGQRKEPKAVRTKGMYGHLTGFAAVVAMIDGKAAWSGPEAGKCRSLC